MKQKFINLKTYLIGMCLKVFIAFDSSIEVGEFVFVVGVEALADDNGFTSISLRLTAQN